MRQRDRRSAYASRLTRHGAEARVRPPHLRTLNTHSSTHSSTSTCRHGPTRSVTRHGKPKQGGSETGGVRMPADWRAMAQRPECGLPTCAPFTLTTARPNVAMGPLKK